MEITITNPSEVDWVKYAQLIVALLTAGIAVLNVVSLIVLTVVIHKVGEKERKRQATARYYETFTSESFHATRSFAWRAAQNWYLDEKYRDEVFDYPLGADQVFAFSRLPENKRQEISAVWRMIEFLSLVESLQADEQFIVECGFYYDWWRIFLLEWCDHIEAQYKRGVDLFIKDRFWKNLPLEPVRTSPIRFLWRKGAENYPFSIEKLEKIKVNCTEIDADPTLSTEAKRTQINHLRDSEIKKYPLTTAHIEEKIRKQFPLSSPITQFRKLDSRLKKNSFVPEPDKDWHLIYRHLTVEALKVTGEGGNGLWESYQKTKSTAEREHLAKLAEQSDRQREVTLEESKLQMDSMPNPSAPTRLATPVSDRIYDAAKLVESIIRWKKS